MAAQMNFNSFSQADQDFLAAICELMRLLDEVEDFIQKNHGRLVKSRPQASRDDGRGGLV